MKTLRKSDLTLGCNNAKDNNKMRKEKCQKCATHISIKHTHTHTHWYTRTHTHWYTHTHTNTQFIKLFLLLSRLKLLHVTERAPGWLLILSVTFFFLSFFFLFSFKSKRGKRERMIELGCVGDREGPSAFANKLTTINKQTIKQTERHSFVLFNVKAFWEIISCNKL